MADGRSCFGGLTVSVIWVWLFERDLCGSHLQRSRDEFMSKPRDACTLFIMERNMYVCLPSPPPLVLSFEA
jgi:hypothetical protein